ncbi:hypothetical protein L207DRAFT_591511 [Hyaloscypha variabilis F]|uniref:2EXR domain-containing protein n=1 Tax=Hyaloscypha variabilis (strain UAMH 11265 / GT02V1 / F) TaxID=1149755 RepID=A0A2J6QZ69_HYAVF|nr:hypothetical protein L207DRAFT_591511 [Hyaloscypha variabilis F]
MTSTEKPDEAVAPLSIGKNDDSIPSPTSEPGPGPTQDPLTKFTCFPKLPIELRLRIWKFAAFIPRNVDVWIGPEKTSYDEDGDYWDIRIDIENHHYFCSRTSPPAILHTSHESRKEGLLVYKLGFGTEHHAGRHHFRSDPTIYANSSSDTLCLMNASKFVYQNNNIFEKIESCYNASGLRSIAFNMADIAWVPLGGLWPTRQLRVLFSVMVRLRNLEEVILFILEDNEEHTSFPCARIEFRDIGAEEWDFKSRLEKAKGYLKCSLTKFAESRKIEALNPIVRLCKMKMVRDPRN